MPEALVERAEMSVETAEVLFGIAGISVLITEAVVVVDCINRRVSDLHLKH